MVDSNQVPSKYPLVAVGVVASAAHRACPSLLRPSRIDELLRYCPVFYALHALPLTFFHWYALSVELRRQSAGSPKRQRTRDLFSRGTQ